MLINIINYEEGRYSGILSKYAYKMQETLIALGHEATVTPLPDPSRDYDAYHHINYQSYRHINGINTLMVTHIWAGPKMETLKNNLITADMGICFSSDTENLLKAQGLPKDKLTTVLPAHDGRPRRRLIIALTTNIYPDGCKREEMFVDLIKSIDNTKFGFRIMGKDWESTLTPLVESHGLQVNYFKDFDPLYYEQILDSADYYLYLGEDEGSMGVLDAKHAGLRIISTNQGFHKDLGIDIPFNSQGELNAIFKAMEYNPVEDWTWENYCKQHIEIWTKLQSA